MDLFAADCRFKLPREVWLVLPGLRGREGFGQVPHSATTIAVNYALAAPVVPKIHFVSDAQAPHTWWWSAAPDGVKRVYSRKLAERTGVRADFTFDQDPGLTPTDYQPRPGVIRCNGSGLGGGLQLCWHCGPPRMIVHVIGADMTGDGYFDGSHIVQYAGDHWAAYHATCEALVKWLRAQGMVIEFVTPTALNLD